MFFLQNITFYQYICIRKTNLNVLCKNERQRSVRTFSEKYKNNGKTIIYRISSGNSSINTKEMIYI